MKCWYLSSDWITGQVLAALVKYANGIDCTPATLSAKWHWHLVIVLSFKLLIRVSALAMETVMGCLSWRLMLGWCIELSPNISSTSYCIFYIKGLYRFWRNSSMVDFINPLLYILHECCETDKTTVSRCSKPVIQKMIRFLYEAFLFASVSIYAITLQMIYIARHMHVQYSNL